MLVDALLFILKVLLALIATGAITTLLAGLLTRFLLKLWRS